MRKTVLGLLILAAALSGCQAKETAQETTVVVKTESVAETENVSEAGGKESSVTSVPETEPETAAEMTLGEDEVLIFGKKVKIDSEIENALADFEELELIDHIDSGAGIWNVKGQDGVKVGSWTRFNREAEYGMNLEEGILEVYCESEKPSAIKDIQDPDGLYVGKSVTVEELAGLGYSIAEDTDIETGATFKKVYRLSDQYEVVSGCAVEGSTVTYFQICLQQNEFYGHSNKITVFGEEIAVDENIKDTVAAADFSELTYTGETDWGAARYTVKDTEDGAVFAKKYNEQTDALGNYIIVDFSINLGYEVEHDALPEREDIKGPDDIYIGMRITKEELEELAYRINLPQIIDDTEVCRLNGCFLGEAEKYYRISEKEAATVTYVFRHNMITGMEISYTKYLDEE